MKKIFFIVFILFVVTCSTLTETLFSPPGVSSSDSSVDFRDEMREFVLNIADYANQYDTNFILIPQNGSSIIYKSVEDETVNLAYLNAIDGIGQEDLFYGYDNDNVPTPDAETEYILDALSIYKNHNKKILVTDYVFANNRSNSITTNLSLGHLIFPAPQRMLNVIPGEQPINVNTNDIYTLNEASNFLYIIGADGYDTKEDLLSSFRATDYDVILMDAYFSDDTLFSASQIASLKVKSNGGRRLVISYLSIGEAEDYRYYWQTGWKIAPPVFLERENPDWEGNYKVKYWLKDWQDIIYGNDSSYLKKIIDCGYDGIYMDIIDGYEYFEDKYNM